MNRKTVPFFSISSNSWPVRAVQLFMSASEAGSSESISRVSPTVIPFMASRVLRMGMRQKSPTQSSFRSAARLITLRKFLH